MGINFLELKQGNGTVEEYEAKFTELARLVLVSKTERQRGFYQGLKAWIKGKPSILELDNYVALVQKAMIIEATGR